MEHRGKDSDERDLPNAPSPVALSRRDSLGLLLAAPALLSAQSGESQPPRDVLLYGGASPPAASIELRAGPLSVSFEPETAVVRAVRYGNMKLLHGIYAAVRDRNWGTIRPEVSELRILKESDRFETTFTVRCQDSPVDFVWKGSIRGDASGTLHFTFDGTAQSAFFRNRVGFCILHPAELAGASLRVESADGETLEGRFPQRIAPHQPFLNIRALRHSIADGLEAETRMTGDVFEMEDQRNWTDASYKTYCTPLALPFPVELQKGQRIQQEVTVSLKGNGRRPVSVSRPPLATEIVVEPGSAFPLPELGLSVSSVAGTLNANEVALLRRLQLGHLRAGIRLSDPGAFGAVERAATEAAAIGARLSLALHLGGDPETEIASILPALRGLPVALARVHVFHRDVKQVGEAWLRRVRRALDLSPNVPLCGGSDAYFTELNRFRPPLEALDGVGYSLNPQVHAFDNLSMLETLPMQAETVASAKAFCGSLPIHVGPVTLKPRFNPAATTAVPVADGTLRELPPEVDPRQPSLFAASWTLGSLKWLAESGAASVCYYETAGWRGVLETADGAPLPARFPSRPGMVFPVYHVLAAAADYRGGESVRVGSSQSLAVDALLLRKDNRRRLIVANYTDRPQVVRISGASWGARTRVRMLDEHTAGPALADPARFWGASSEGEDAMPPQSGDGILQLGLLAYALAFIDG
ncbi:MAG: hypothetical protein U5J83_19195 [Bryobacterales bacterium]|nr:hypothetical protein [Bryobacterales bacterium]